MIQPLKSAGVERTAVGCPQSSFLNIVCIFSWQGLKLLHSWISNTIGSIPPAIPALADGENRATKALL